MGQKIHPNIFRLGKTKNWDSKYFEKKSTETPKYTFKDLEIKKFINKFFKDHGLIVHTCKTHYLDEGSLHIFISYYLTLKSVLLINKTNHNQQVKLIKVKKQIKNKQRYTEIQKRVKKYVKYQKLNSNKTLNLAPLKNKRKIIKNNVKSKRNALKFRRVQLLKYYKRYNLLENQKEFKSIQDNTFLEKLFKSVQLFLNKTINISVTLKQLNKDIKKDLGNNNIKLLKQTLVKLKKYRYNEFFKEGVNIMFTANTKKRSSSLLAQFIATQLQQLKRHNFFLKFIKTTLTVFNHNKLSKIKGIKIKVKGRINGAPRAKSRIINIGNGVSTLTVNSNVDYSETTAFTSNGTFGIKVWISEN